MVIDIREVRPHDKAEWLQLWEGYTHFYGSPQPEEVTECTWQRMLDVNSPVLGRVAVVNDTVVGFAICILHEGTGSPRQSAIWRICSSIQLSADKALPER